MWLVTTLLTGTPPRLRKQPVCDVWCCHIYNTVLFTFSLLLYCVAALNITPTWCQMLSRGSSNRARWVCVCVLPVNSAYCVPTGAFRLWRHCHDLTTNSINTKSCWMFSVSTTEPAQLCVVLLQWCEANRTCQLIVSKCCGHLSLILAMQHITCNDGSSWPTHTFI